MPFDPLDVEICVAGAPPDAGRERRPAEPIAPPIVQTSLFSYPDFGSLVDALSEEHVRPVYSRGQNPTVETVERSLAALERGEAGKCFGSGMAAISAVMLGLLQAGDHLLFVNQVYGPAVKLARHLERFGIEHDVLLDTAPGAVEGAMRPETRLVWLESPGTMTFRLLDVAAVAEVAHAGGAAVCMDNSWATPLLQKPLELGADLVVHSCTKYVGGHSDVVAGALVTDADRMSRIFYRAFLLNGGILGPFDAWLLHRGLRSLPARLGQHGEDALRVARQLAEHPAVARVHHPALSGAPARLREQLSGWSGLFSFELARPGFAEVGRFIDALERFRIGVSWGGTESLVISPERPGNAAELEARGIPRGLVRLSIGLEGAGPLIEDLERALERVA